MTYDVFDGKQWLLRAPLWVVGRVLDLQPEALRRIERTAGACEMHANFRPFRLAPRAASLMVCVAVGDR